MTDNLSTDVRRLKQRLRAEALTQRTMQPNADHLSRRIFEHLAALPEYVRCRTLMLYLDIGSEVRTRWFLPEAWRQGKRVVVPYCRADQLGLFRLEDCGELAPGAMGILEPRAELRDREERKIAPAELDVIVVPGVAFDRRGGRLGYGKGYYDKLLRRVGNDALKAAVCFECQILVEIPQSPHDVRMDVIVSEQEAYRV